MTDKLLNEIELSNLLNDAAQKRDYEKLIGMDFDACHPNDFVRFMQSWLCQSSDTSETILCCLAVTYSGIQSGWLAFDSLRDFVNSFVTILEKIAERFPNYSQDDEVLHMIQLLLRLANSSLAKRSAGDQNLDALRLREIFLKHRPSADGFYRGKDVSLDV